MLYKATTNTKLVNTKLLLLAEREWGSCESSKFHPNLIYNLVLRMFPFKDTLFNIVDF